MKSFADILYEAAIEGFMAKIGSCQTLEGLKELEKYYKTRSKETELRDSDDISVRDALEGKKAELSSIDDEAEEDF